MQLRACAMLIAFNIMHLDGATHLTMNILTNLGS